MKPNKKLIGEIVCVEWLDATQCDDETLQGIKLKNTKEDFLAKSFTYGMVMKFDKDAIILSFSIAKNNNFDILTIPIGMITQIKILKEQ